MNEFDNTHAGENENPQTESLNENTEKSVNENDNSKNGIVFDDDGTYHGTTHEKEYTNENVNARSSFKQNTYSDGAYSQTGYNNSGNNGTYPYSNTTGNGSYGYQNSNNNGSNNNANNSGYNANYSQNSYPYGNNANGYSYNNNGYPYNNKGTSNYAYDANGGKKKNKGIKAFAITAGVLCVLLVVALVCILVSGNNNDVSSGEENTSSKSESISQNTNELQTENTPNDSGEATADGSLSPKNIYNKVLPSSVGILVYNKSKSLASEGSGVLFQEANDGKHTYVITCAHVINDASGYIIVQTYDGKEYEAEVVGFDSRTDIGVLKIEASGLTLAEIGDSSKLVVGEYVYAIGNPGGVEFANSFTNGIISALDRPVDSSDTGYTMDCIQHTAAINPGNSGGALVNSFGQVIGINSMKIVADEYEGMGFAVPSSVFVKIVNEIMANGYVTNRPKLGITYVAASQYSNYGMFVAIKGLPSGSIVIYDISEESSLAGTKAEKGDMIVGVNGNPLDDATALSELIENSSVGDEITLSIVRIYDDYSYDEFDVKVTLIEDKGTSSVTESQEETTGSSQMPGGYDDFEDYFRDFFENYYK